MLSALDPQKVCFLIVKIRAFDIQAQPNLGGGSDAADDNFVAVYDNEANPSVLGEAEGLIEAMNVDEKRELIALSLIGRGAYAQEEWADAMNVAGSHPEPTTAAYLMGDPLVSDSLEEGLSMFGFSCDDVAEERVLDAPSA